METRRIRSRLRKSIYIKRRRKRIAKLESMKLESENIIKGFLRHAFSWKNRLASGDKI
ncbi:MAG: hypothetical protein NTY68_04665 [Candidatus Micrarchaeota archaeon]|nr:hypothetical protein [Candidatus Micrarchaeota archaeon]